MDSSLLIGRDWTVATGGGRFAVVDPATGRKVGSAADATAADVAGAVDAAAAALPGWRETAARQRSRVLHRCAGLLRERTETIAAVLTAEQGKPLAEARAEVEYAASFFEWFAGEAERVYGQVVPAVDPTSRVLVWRQPVGVVAAITPWNLPVALAARKLAAAMAAGCTTIVKPAEATPLSTALLLRAVTDAGTPPGVANLVTLQRPEVFSEVIFGDARVRKVSFTGSTEVGKHLLRRSADQVKRVSVELGGHAPYLVFADADLPLAVEGIIGSKFRNAGQTCVCANRVLVQRPVYRRVVELLAQRAGRLAVGPGTEPDVQVGPLIDAAAVQRMQEQVADAVRCGARVATGGHRLTGARYGDGFFYAPTVLDGITAQMRISVEETFGPVLGVAPFDTEQEALEAANDSVYGLAAYVHTRDYARLLRVAERLDYGMVGANTGLISAANVPFGGMKESGYGREGGAAGIDEYLDTRYLLIGGVSG